MASYAPSRSNRRYADTTASSQTLHVFVEAAASRSPELAGLGGRQTVIGARQSSANLWTPAPPTVSGSYLTDQALRNRQQREAQIGISTPIWLPGEGTASRRVADAEMARSAAQIIVIKLKIAGQVRDSLAEFALAKAEASLAERRLRDARALEADVRRRSGVREASDADVLLAQAERITADSELRERRVALEQSKLDFESLTGMPPAVAALREPLAPDTTNPHPRIEEAKGAVDVARANRSLAGIQTRESPEIGLIARRNRDIYGTVFDNSIGVEVRIPLSTEARNGPRQAAAQAELTEATAGFSAVEREIALEQRKARLGYDNALVQRDLAVERAKVLTRQSGLVARGFQAGQTSLFDTIRARTLAYEAEIAGSRAEIGVAKARSRLNQAVGAVP
jgi:cobalt-zinc-cadmium efflux system outer membrane protein